MVKEYKLFARGSGRYRMKVVAAPLGNCQNVTPPWVVEVLEALDEPGWEVCAVSPAGTELWITYRRTGALN